MSEPFDIAKLKRQAESLPSPEDYFKGSSFVGRFVPNNILLFSRQHQEHSLLGYDGISERSGKFDQHHRFVLLIGLSGEGGIGVERNTYRFGERTAMLIFPHQLHYYTEVPENFCWLYFTFESPVGAHEEVESLRDSPRALETTHLNKIERLIQDYKEGAHPLDLSSRLLKLIQSIMQTAPKDRSAVRDNPREEGAAAEIVHKIKRFIYSNLDCDIRIADVAKHLEFSESYVRAAFKRRIGISLGHFVLAVRLTHSANLLRTTEKKIGEISADCGFDSQLSFSRAFKRSFRVSPREYRKQIPNRLASITLPNGDEIDLDLTQDEEDTLSESDLANYGLEQE